MTNEDVIDLYKRVKPGTVVVVVVLAPHQGDSPFSPRMAASGNPQMSLRTPAVFASISIIYLQLW
jgi:hypothetical protein